MTISFIYSALTPTDVETSSIFRNDGASDGATGTKGCAASREDPLGRRVAPQRALDDDAAARARQGLALENGQSPHALLAHRVAADERHSCGVEANGACGGVRFFFFAAALARLRNQLTFDNRVRAAPTSDGSRKSPNRSVNGVSGFLLRVVEPDVARRRRRVGTFRCGITC